MYISPVTPEEAEKFLYGFDVGCFACGVHIPWQDVTNHRGFTISTLSPVVEMRAKGMADDAIIDELISFRIDALRNGSNSNE